MLNQLHDYDNFPNIKKQIHVQFKTCILLKILKIEKIDTAYNGNLK